MIAETTAEDETEVILKIRKLVWSDSGRPFEWYVGVSADPERRLFQDHGVRRRADQWKIERVRTPDEAHRIVTYFMQGIGTDGVVQRLPRGPAHVYVFHKGANTRPALV